MISRINISPSGLAFGVVTNKAAQQALKLAGNNQDEIDRVNKLINDSEINAPDVYIFYNNEENEGFYNKAFFYNKNGNYVEFEEYYEPVIRLSVFEWICKSAEKIQKEINSMKN